MMSLDSPFVADELAKARKPLPLQMDRHGFRTIAQARAWSEPRTEAFGEARAAAIDVFLREGGPD